MYKFAIATALVATITAAGVFPAYACTFCMPKPKPPAVTDIQIKIPATKKPIKVDKFDKKKVEKPKASAQPKIIPCTFCK